MISKSHITTMLSVLLFLGCGGGSVSTSGSGANTENSKDLVGTWSTGCKFSYQFSSIQTEVYSANTMNLEFTSHRGPRCAAGSIVTHFTATSRYTTGGATKFSNGIDAIELNTTQTSFNVVKGTPDGSLRQSGTHYGMYGIDGNKLLRSSYLNGDANDGSTPDKRARRLADFYLVRQ